MAKTIDLNRLRHKSTARLVRIVDRAKAADEAHFHYFLIRWMCAMSAVEAHAIWERYVESRLAAALNHAPSHFLPENDVRGVKSVSSGLAFYVIRGGGRFFDFRSMSDLSAGLGARCLAPKFRY